MPVVQKYNITWYTFEENDPLCINMIGKHILVCAPRAGKMATTPAIVGMNDYGDIVMFTAGATSLEDGSVGIYELPTSVFAQSMWALQPVADDQAYDIPCTENDRITLAKQKENMINLFGTDQLENVAFDPY